MQNEKRELYQTVEMGRIRFFDTGKELLDAKEELQNIDKLSFNGLDGTRIRLVHQGDGLFTITMWEGYSYKVFPGKKTTLVGKLHK